MSIKTKAIRAHPWWSLAIVYLVAVGGLVIGLFTTGSASGQNGGTSATAWPGPNGDLSSSARSRSPDVTDVQNTPNDIVAVTGASSGGSWVWADGPSSATVFHVSASGQPDDPGAAVSYADAPALQTVGLAQGMAEGSPGHVWIGAGTTLVEFDTTTGAVKVLSIPKPEPNGQAEANTPSPASGDEFVEAVAANADDEVVVALAQAAALVVYRTAAGFTTLPLPAVGDAHDVAILPDGTIAAGLDDYASSVGTLDTVALYSPTGAMSTVSAPSWAVTAAGDRFVASLSDVSLIQPDGLVTSVPGVTTSPHVHPTYVAGSHSVVLATQTGIEEIDVVSGAVTRDIDLGTTSCGGAPPQLVGPGQSANENLPAGQCNRQPDLLSSDPFGNLYFIIGQQAMVVKGTV